MPDTEPRTFFFYNYELSKVCGRPGSSLSLSGISLWPKKKKTTIFSGLSKNIFVQVIHVLHFSAPRTITIFDVISITFIFTIQLVWPHIEKVPGSISILPEFKVCTKFFGVWSHTSFLPIICVYEAIYGTWAGNLHNNLMMHQCSDTQYSAHIMNKHFIFNAFFTLVLCKQLHFTFVLICVVPISLV